VRPFLQRLSMQTGETANLSVLDGHEIVYLARSNSPRIVSIGFHPGARIPAHVVSPGFAILSTFPTPRLDAWLAAHDFGQFTPNTMDAERFQAAVAAARQLGYWFADQYLDTGLGGLATALHDRQGRCVGALSMTFQIQSWPHERALAVLLPALKEAVQVTREII
jgi:IclR family pca regulon transcriptional regulator